MKPVDHLKEPTRGAQIRLINSLSGAKSANLIGSISQEGHENLSIVSSTVHLGSFPPLFGVVFRPLTVRRDTFDNIMDMQRYTINHVSVSMIQKAHQTSGKYPQDISEFSEVGLNPLYREGFQAPFVEESLVQMAMELKEVVEITSNQTQLVVGQLTALYLSKDLLMEDGTLDFEKAQTVSVGGLNHYYALSWKAFHEQVKLGET